MLLALVRLAWLQWNISHTVYQGDFTAYWAAGRAVLAGADPYSHQVHSADGAAFYYTGFLYPPLVASFFAPLARLDFYHAKLAWSALQLLFLLGALTLAGPLLWPRSPLAGTAVLLAATAVFPPVQLEFERGQIDCLTFLLVVGAAWAWVVRRNSVLTAVLLVAAGLFKLPTLLLLVVPLACRDRVFVKAAAASLTAVALLSLALNGPRLTSEYWLHDLPALAGLTQGRVISSRLPPSVPTPPGSLPPSQGGPILWQSITWEGHTYADKSTFPTRGSFVSSYMSPVPERLRRAASGAGFLLALVVLALAGRAFRQAAPQQQDWQRQALLAFGMVTILVCYPLSWLMNYVWLLYAAPALLLAVWRWQAPRFLWYMALGGALLNFTGAVPHATGLLYKALDQRFCLGSLLLYLSGAALLLWSRDRFPKATGLPTTLHAER